MKKLKEVYEIQDFDSAEAIGSPIMDSVSWMILSFKKRWNVPLRARGITACVASKTLTVFISFILTVE